MKRVLASAVVMAAMFASVPLEVQTASAQPAYGSRYGSGGWDSNMFWRGAPNDTWQRIDYLQRRIDRGVRDGTLDRREARRAQRELNRIRADAQVMRRYRGGWRENQRMTIQARLDNLSRNIRSMRRDREWWGGTYSAGYGNGYRGDGYGNYRTDYDAVRYYRSGPQYQERVLTSDDYVYRGSDGRYYCKRNDGTTGLIVGGLAGGVLGNVADGGSNRVAGTLIGGALGALLGREIDRNSGDQVRCR